MIPTRLGGLEIGETAVFDVHVLLGGHSVAFVAAFFDGPAGLSASIP